MNIDDGRVLALTGAMLAEGDFRFEGAEAHSFLRPANALIAVSNRTGWVSTEFGLAGNARRDGDGFWSADWPVHSLALQGTLPPLDRLLDFPSFALSAGIPSDRVRFDLSAEHSYFARVTVDSVRDEERRGGPLVGLANAVTLEAQRTADGFEFAIEARVEDAKRREERAAPFTVHVTAALSYATMALAGSGLWWRGGADRWKQAAEDQSGALAEVLTLDRAGGTPYFRGTLDLGPGQPGYSRGPWVKASVSDYMLRLTPQRELHGRGGFVAGNNHGPDLVFDNLGFAAWRELLATADEAVLEQKGRGIGHVQGVTGRDVCDEGPHLQAISAVRIRLFRSEEGVRITFDGELGEIQQKPLQPVLGPEFHGDFMIPTAFLFARDVRLRNQWAERERRLKRQ